MGTDYQFLIGQRFSIGGEIYVVEELTSRNEQIYVRAQAPDDADIVLREPTTSGDGLLFKLTEVIQTLLVDEEIELSHPNYLTAL